MTTQPNEAGKTESHPALASAQSPADALAVINRLIKAKTLVRESKMPGFALWLQRLVGFLVQTGDAHGRLLAATALGRISAVAKPTAKQIAAALAGFPIPTLPPLLGLPDPTDRYYAARVWRFLSASWMPGYLASSAVAEDTAETVRRECLEGMFSLAETMDLIFSELQKPIADLRFTTQEPGNSASRRLRKILIAVAKNPRSFRLPPTKTSASQLRSLLEQAFRANPPPESLNSQIELADAVSELIDLLIRAQFSLSTESDTYSPLASARNFFRQIDWRHYAENSAQLKAVAADLREGIKILMRAGLTDDELYRSLALVCGSDAPARSTLTALASEMTGLSEAVQLWASGRNAPRRSEWARESQEIGADEVFAELLLDLRRLSAQARVVSETVLPELEVLAPRKAEPLVRTLGTAEAAAGRMEFLAKRRFLRTRGEPGAVVEYNPLEHALVGEQGSGARYVRLLSPVVESALPSGDVRIVRKAMVEPGPPPSA